MGVLWLLSMAAVCCTPHRAMAWHAGNQSTPIAPNIHAYENRTEAVLHEDVIKEEDSPENKREKRGAMPMNGRNIENELEKRDTTKVRFSSWAGKRYFPDGKRAKFSSWGGKRSSGAEENENYEDDVYEQKRAKFTSWGGKRGYGDNEKRAKFSSWESNDFDTIEGLPEDKRSKFNSWAGKRMELGDNKRQRFSSWAGKRARFNSWAGKRSGNGDPNPEGEGGKRAKFSSWAGKRDPNYVGASWGRGYPEGKAKAEGGGSEDIVKLWQDLMSRKRARFSSWAGKREGAEGLGWSGNRKNESAEDGAGVYRSGLVKRSAWGGQEYKRKPIFSSWGGKRSGSGHSIRERSIPLQRLVISGGREVPWSSLMRPIRRGPDFYAWGGKRSA